MLRDLRCKIAQTITGIRPPQIRSVSPVFPVPTVSNNVCFQMDTLEQTASTLNLETEGFDLPWRAALNLTIVEYDFDKIDLSEQAFAFLNPGSESIRLPWRPDLGIVAVVLNFDKIGMFRVKESQLFIKVVETFDCLEIFESSVWISEDLLRPLRVCKTDGKCYNESHQHQIDLFGKTDTEGKSPSAIRKAYTETKTPYSTVVRKLTIWDILFPILQPPLSFDFEAQIDFHKPLFRYQRKGIEFLVENQTALLADEMGTGKTVMAIVALRILFRQGLIKQALIVCPSSIVGSARLSQITGKSEGWDGHLYHWAPDLQVTVVRGAQKDRQKDWLYPTHVYITTYDTLRNDIQIGALEDLSKEFDCVIVDEAQYIKNPQSERAKSVRSLKAQRRWALTGTPVENRVDDVVAIFDFLTPHLFKGQVPASHIVMQKIRPYFLRRLKRDVMRDLPPKIRQEEWLELDSDQWETYTEVLQGGRQRLAEMDDSVSEFQLRRHIFALLGKLKQICNFAPGKMYSPKAEALIELVENIVENNKKVLIFSQYLNEGIDKLQLLLKRFGCVTYSGQTSPQERDRAIQVFRSPDSDIHVFLATVRTAGTGISLTEATYVIHFDHWWNPAVMWQAEDRAHRHGQTEPLNVYSLWMQDTIEERIYQKLKEKGLLIESVIDALSEEALEGMITTNEWLEMLGVERKKKLEDADVTQKNPQELLRHIQNLSPLEFEEFVRKFFVAIGYTNARTTPRSYDGGIDVFASHLNIGQEEEIVAQCKRTEVVGVEVARELMGVMAANPRISKGFLVTSGRISEACKNFCESNGRLAWIDGIRLTEYAARLNLEI